MRPVVTPRSRQPKRLSAGVVVVNLVIVALAFGRQTLALNADAQELGLPIDSKPTINQSCLDNHPPKAADSLLDLVNARLAWMPAVARSKWILDLPIEDEARERAVLASAVAEVNRYAKAVNLPLPSEQAILKFYTAQIEAAKALQRRWMNQPTIRTRSARSWQANGSAHRSTSSQPQSPEWASHRVLLTTPPTAKRTVSRVG